MALIGPGGRPVQSSAGASAAAPAEGSAFIKDANLESFAADVLDASREVPVIVDFWAPWCGPCLGFAPVFVQAASELEPRVRLAKLDTEAQPQLAQRFAIRSIPTLIMFHQGHELARQSGALNATQLRQFVETTLARK